MTRLGLRSRLRRNTMLGDALLMLVLALFTLLGTADFTTAKRSYQPQLSEPVALLMGAGFTLPLLWRRTRPFASALAFLPACLMQLALFDSIVPGDVVVPMAMYAAARYATPRRARIVLVIGLIGSAAAGADWGWNMPYAPTQDLGSRVGRMLVNAIPCVAVVLACWFWGQWTRQRELTLQTLRDRAESLEREREQGARLVAQEERNRLAREMHDIVAHSLSVIVVQADGAGYLAGHDELGDAEARLAQVTKAIETIGKTARSALGETRRLVGVLRDEADSAELAPAATLDQIGDLVAQVGSAGVPARFVESGDPHAHPELAQGAQMAAYRVVQESLTNVLKHAGRGATVTVSLDHDAQGIRLTVSDTGLGATETDGLGHGVVGMRERVQVWGGTLSAGPRPTGGFEVRATVPAVAPAPPAPGAPTSTTPAVASPSPATGSSPGADTASPSPLRPVAADSLARQSSSVRSA